MRLLSPPPAFPSRLAKLEEVIQERGAAVDYSPLNRWILKYAPPLEAAFHRRKWPVRMSWRLHETYIRVRGHWRYLYRAVDKAGQQACHSSDVGV